jgi:hypothetical protein
MFSMSNIFIEIDKRTSKISKILYETFFNMLRITNVSTLRIFQIMSDHLTQKGRAVIKIMKRYGSLNFIIILSMALRTG